MGKSKEAREEVETVNEPGRWGKWRTRSRQVEG
jgi:hypothetical protein